MTGRGNILKNASYILKALLKQNSDAFGSMFLYTPIVEIHISRERVEIISVRF